ncbi:hypothetical protein SLEP1_g34858 [Rubroshorea leprosula]|uniref:Secreted protein n=1 Tax=Rubroshorea leprosula TaxID=152421 RepID=A0AAV5KLL8_9ROSI|nr:hypothetical protein SLEP1_g34858 [Rubroshorea leprosula]
MCSELRWPPWPVGSVAPLVWRPSFSSDGSVVARTRAARSNAHHGSPVGSKGLRSPDRVTAPHSAASPQPKRVFFFLLA